MRPASGKLQPELTLDAWRAADDAQIPQEAYVDLSIRHR
jgi:hypothetical protein